MSFIITDITVDQLPMWDDRFHPLLCEESEDIVISELLHRGCADGGTMGSSMLVIYNNILTRFTMRYCEEDYDMHRWFRIVSEKPLAPVDDLI